MPTPQEGIVPEPGAHALFLVLRVPRLRRDGAAVGRALARVPALARAVARLDARAGLRAVVSVGPGLWDVLSRRRRPAGLRPFRRIEAGARVAPATGGDVLVHVTSQRADVNFELAMRLGAGLGGAVEPLDEVHGFRYFDTRDLTGFMDGTENPHGRTRARVALIGREDAAFAGGSYVFTQRYVHDLAGWAKLPVAAQERVIGRTKRDSRELPPSRKPPTSHISRVVIEEHGAELQIVRHSFPYGTLAEAGLFFVAYTRDLGIPEKMLARMMGASGDRVHDHLMHHSRAVTGATFFAPSLQLLRTLA